MNEAQGEHEFVISHHMAESPHRIDVARDETVFIQRISIEASADFWLEFHSATESRLIQKQVSALQKIDDEIITRHKGSVNFSRSSEFDFVVLYVKLKSIK